MNTSATVSAARAVASDIISYYVGRLLLIITAVVGFVSVSAFLLASLTSNWWWLLFIITLPFLLAFGALFAIVHLIAGKIAPRKMSKLEIKQTREFVSGVQNAYISTRALKQSPKMIGFHALYAFVTGGRKKAVKAVMDPIENTKSLKNKFNDLSNLFS